MQTIMPCGRLKNPGSCHQIANCQEEIPVRNSPWHDFTTERHDRAA